MLITWPYSELLETLLELSPFYDFDLEFYNLQPVDGGILKNIGNRTSEFNVLIHNNTYSNQNVIINKIIDTEATEVLQGKYGFEWNKIESVFEKNYYEVIEISELRKTYTKYLERLRDANNFILIKIIRALSPIKIFQPIQD